MPKSPIRVLLVDDQQSFRHAAAVAISVSAGLRLIGSVADAESALEFAGLNEVDLVLMDVSMPGMGGVAGAGQFKLRHPHVVVTLMSAGDPSALASAAAEAGTAHVHKEQFGVDVILRIWTTAVGIGP